MARTARPATFLTPISWALTALSLLVSVMVIQRTHGAWWSFLLLVVSLGLAALSVRNLRRAVTRSDVPA
jgi:hypothetical protein